MKKILILKTGQTASEVLRVHGDYDRWFTDAMAPHGLAFEVRDVTREPIPDAQALARFMGIIVTGSTSTAYRHETWMGGLISFLRRVDAAAGPPLLGVCFGAQILAHARGGRVVLNPEGWEIGGIRIELAPGAEADPLFRRFPSTFGALATHEDRIEDLPPGAVLLAGNRSSPVQAFRIGEWIWGTQFHPEATLEILEELILLRADQLARDASAHGRDPDGHIERLLETLRRPGIDQGRAVIGNFVRVCLRWEPAKEQVPAEAPPPG